MDDDDEIDILGDFNLEDLLCKKDGRLSFYDGVQSLDIACDYSNVSSHWLLDSNTQSVWDDKHVEPRVQAAQADVPDSGGWTDKEKYLLDKGLELFGKSWARLAQYIGSKSATEVKFYVKNVLCPSGSAINDMFTVWPELDTPSSLLSSDLIDDMEIPASMEEVITAVSTASPTINVPISKAKGTVRRKRRLSRSPCPTQRSKQRKIKRSTKHSVKFIREEKFEEVNEIKSERTINTINDEEVVFLGRSEDEDSEIDVTEDEPHSNTKPFQGYSVSSSHNLTTQQPTTSSDSSLSYSSCDSSPPDNIIKQPEPPSIRDPLELIYQLPDPIEETAIDQDVITQEEENLFPEFFQKGTSMVLRYLKIRNHIIDTWKETKPSYVAKTKVRRCLKNCGDVNLIGRVHFYLEKKGVINYGCSRCRYKIEPYGLYRKLSTENISSSSSFGMIRTRKKKTVLPGSLLNCGGITMAHGDDGRVIQIIQEPLRPRSKKLDILSRKNPLPIQV